MRIIRHDRKWWIADVPPYCADGKGPFTEYGDYATKEEAEEDMRGLQRTMERWEKKRKPRAEPIAEPLPEPAAVICAKQLELTLE